MATIPEIEVVAGCDIFPAARAQFVERWGLLARGTEIHCSRCAECTALVVVDRVMLRDTRCLLCARGRRAC